MLCETPRNTTSRTPSRMTTTGDPNQVVRNSPMRMSPSPSRQNYPPSASQLNRSRTGRSPHDAHNRSTGPSPQVQGQCK